MAVTASHPQAGLHLDKINISVSYTPEILPHVTHTVWKGSGKGGKQKV